MYSEDVNVSGVGWVWVELRDYRVGGSGAWFKEGEGKKGIGCLNSGILSQAACGRLVLLTNLPQKDKFF